MCILYTQNVGLQSVFGYSMFGYKGFIQTKTLLTLQLVKLMNTGLFALPKEINCLKVEIIYILQLDIFLTFIH